MSGILFFIFASCEPLINSTLVNNNNGSKIYSGDFFVCAGNLSSIIYIAIMDIK